MAIRYDRFTMLALGCDGWLDDDRAFVRDWGCDLAQIMVSVAVRQGDLDLMVPAAHGAWLARRLTTAFAREAPGHGHLSLVTSYRDAIVDDLLARVSTIADRSRESRAEEATVCDEAG